MIELSNVDVIGNTGNTLSGDQSEYMCRICLEEGVRRDFIAPCRCSGTSKWVHRKCLDRWRSIKEDTAFLQCMECHAMYETVCISSDNDPLEHRCYRRITFCGLVARDFVLLLAVLVLLIMVVGLLVYLFDLGLHRYFISTLQMKQYPILCYAGISLAAILASVGLYFSCIYMQVCSSPSFHNTSMGGSCQCCDDVMFIPYYVTPDLQPSCCCLECGHCSCCEVCGNATSVGSAEGASSATSTCSCCECAGAEAGHEVLVVLLALFVILAAVGLVVAVFVGAVMLQSIISKHLHVLGKWAMTKEHIVKDLAEDASTEMSSHDWHSNHENSRGGDIEETSESLAPPSFVNSLYAWWGNNLTNRRNGYNGYQAVDNVDYRSSIFNV